MMVLRVSALAVGRASMSASMPPWSTTASSTLLCQFARRHMPLSRFSGCLERTSVRDGATSHVNTLAIVTVSTFAYFLIG